MIQDFKDKFIELYGENNFIIIEKLINSACEASIRYKDYINELDGWGCSLDIEKINALNSYYYINLYNEELEAEINLDFGFGVDMQNELIEYSFDGTSSKYSEKIIEVLDDIVLDEDRIITHFKNNGDLIKNIPNEFFEEILLKKARIVFEKEKPKILDLYNKQNYDNYVTGGGSTSTDNYYKEQFKKYNNMGLYWKLIYKEIEVDRNLY